MRPLPLLATALLVAVTAAARAAPLFLDILPPGQDGLVPASTVTAGAHATDQLAMYRDLILAAPGLAEPDLARFFKDASIDVPAAPERVETPRPGVTVARDAYGVPHVTGATRGDVFFGAGYVTAEDRLFLADALRNMGRGRFTQFAGDLRDVLGAVGFDRTYAAVAGYSEEELQLQINQGIERNPVLGQTVLDDATTFVAGVNAYIAEARADPTKAKLPAEYGLLQRAKQQSVQMAARRLCGGGARESRRRGRRAHGALRLGLAGHVAGGPPQGRDPLRARRCPGGWTHPVAEPPHLPAGGADPAVTRTEDA